MPGALSLCVGDGHRAAVEAIREFLLFLPSGLVLILHNCHYAPSITRGVISVSHLYKDGFVNRFENDNTISVSRNNMVYLCAIPQDDISEIDLSSSNTNDKSMYVISNKGAKLNLDSTLLWHCRLGHINKKRMEKLQHDGLLDSTDIKSFEKCVSCMSGKMARKTYSHQVKRAKDLLGLIYTDVCGLYKISQDNELTTSSLLLTTSVSYNSRSKWELEDLEIIQEEDTHPFINTSLDHEEDDQEIDEPQSDINPIRKSTRIRRGPDRMYLHVDAEEHELGDLGEPANYKAALLDPESDKWLNAMNAEMQSMRDNETDMDGEVHTYKAHLVAKGFTQTPGFDYEETFYPVADIRAIRILIAMAAFYDYEIWQMDVKTGFFNGYLNEEVYIWQMDVKTAFFNGYLNEEVYMEKPKEHDKSICTESSDTKRELKVSCYTIVGYLTDADDLKSQTGYVFVLNRGVVDWKSTKQSIFATSSTDAEYIAIFDASKKAVWIRNFIYGLGIVPTIEEPIKMYCDNTGAIAIAKDHRVTKGARHFRAKVHYVRETIEMGDVGIEKVNTDDMTT
nr:hypothetical protein [Tanacetum cinerariifolium]